MHRHECVLEGKKCWLFGKFCACTKSMNPKDVLGEKNVKKINRDTELSNTEFSMIKKHQE